jgi:putative hemolysin
MNRTQKNLLCFISLLVSTSLATSMAQEAHEKKCSDQREFLLEGKPVTLCWFNALGAWISPSCINKKQVSCGSVELANAAKKKEVDLAGEDLKGGKNPGSVLCTKLGGTVMIAKLPSGSGITFCSANDSTLIDCNSLTNQFFSQK